MSQIYIGAFVALLAQLLPLVGVTIGNDQLTNAISTFITIASGIWIMIRRYQQGNITVSGTRKV